MRPNDDCHPLCINCQRWTHTDQLPCLRETPEAQAKIASRSGQRRPIWSERTVFDEVCAARGKRDPSTIADTLKWYYPAVGYRGKYRQTLMLQEVHRYELRVARLRGVKPRAMDEVAKAAGGLRPGGGLTELVYRENPLFALLKRRSA